MRVVEVPLGRRSYEILIGTRLLGQLSRRCARLKLGRRCAVISDTNVAARYADGVCESLVNGGFEPFTVIVPAGETAKNLSTVSRCYDRLAANRLERKSFIVALGGGVVGDLAGFVAATYLRGVPFIQIPTTLLAQVDSSVGGKVGVNLKAGKNLVGSFYQPRLVICDLNTLDTLPEREFRSGLAEVIKYGIIYDSDLFSTLERRTEALLNRDSKLLTEIVARCCQIKSDVVRQDETESGLRAILNFGHTVGHALEAISHYGKYLHGEAISIGQIAAAALSHKLTNLPAKDAERIATLLKKAGLPTKLQLTSSQQNQLLRAMQLDKKVSDGEVKFVLARRIGKVEFGRNVPAKMLSQVLQASSLIPETTNVIKNGN